MRDEAPPPRDDAESNEDSSDRDLGFGSVVADTAAQRLLNRDGTFNVRRKGLAWRHVLSIYHSLLELSWPRFLALGSVAYLLTNLLFAAAYYLAGPEALRGSLAGRPFLQAFFFSIETISTVGYGNIAPVSVAAHLLVTIEIMVALFGVALIAGIVFARFSRPKAEIVFSDHAVVAPYRGITGLMFRIANLRSSQIIELSAKVILSRLERDDNGEKHRRFYTLPLERDRVTFFPLSWTIVHPIDENSPLAGASATDCNIAQMEILILLTGIDESFSQTVHKRTSYLSSEIVWNARFAPIFEVTDGEMVVSIDVDRIHEWESVETEVGG